MNNSARIKNMHDTEDNHFNRVLELADRLSRQETVDVDRHWKSLQYRLGKQNQKNKGFLYWAQIVAFILLFPALFLSAYLFYKYEHLKGVSEIQCQSTVAYGVRTHIFLSDSTEVWLNSGSTLSYPRAFTADRRQVKLEGEAYFKVKSHSSCPFDVHVQNNVRVTAYGTEFNVKAYAEEEDIKATLAEGVIEMRNQSNGSHKFLEPGEQAIFNKKEKNLTKKIVNLQVETSWKDGKMVFRRTPMGEVAHRLSTHFNVDIRIKEKAIYNYSYSATFTNESLDEILSLLEVTAPLRFEVIKPKQNNNLSFTKKRVYIYFRD